MKIKNSVSIAVLMTVITMLFTASAFAQGTQVNLSSAFNRIGTYTDGSTFPSNGGIDGNGDAYSATLLGSQPAWNNETFSLGTANTSNVVYGAGQTITLPSGQFIALQMLAASVNGSHTSQTITVTYTDNSTSTFTQNFSNWYSSQRYSGESIALSMSYHDIHTGGSSNAVNLYGYSFALDSAKTVQSVTLPNNNDIVVLAMTLTVPVVTQCTITSGSICQPYSYAGVSDPSVNLVNVQNENWGSGSQTLYAVNPGSWYSVSNYPTGDTAIDAFPNSDAVYVSSTPTIASYTSLISSFSHNMNLNSNTDAEAAYDMFFLPDDSQTGQRYEVMIWTQQSNRGEPAGCSQTRLAQTTFGGSNGVPQYTWDLYSCSQGEYTWELDPTQFNSSFSGVYGLTSGSVDVLSMVKYLQGLHGSMTWTVPSTAYLSQLEYGFEIASTGGLNETFQVNGWTIESTPGGSPCAMNNSNSGGNCQYSLIYNEVTPNDVNLINVQMALFDTGSGYTQTMTAYDQGNWNTVDNFPNGATAIEAYPNSDVLFNSGTTIDSLVPITGSFWHNMNLNANTDAEAAWDMSFNNASDEVMIWTQMSHRGEPAGCTQTQLAQTTFGGSNGVVPYVWDLYSCSTHEWVWELDPAQFGGSNWNGVWGITSGSVDVGAMLQWLETNGYLPAGSTVNQIEYGFEIASTGGQNETFQVLGWALNDGTATNTH